MEENLLIEYHQNLLDAANRKAVADWIAESSENQATYTQCVQIWQHAKEAAALQGLEVEADLQAVRQQLGISVAASPKRQSSMVWRIAALILLAIGLAWGGYQLSGPGAQPPMLSQETGDQPGAIFALADGSQIRLNAHSRLRYPAKFTGNRRQLELEGEAWFHVKADKAHPFVIHHQNSQTEVLGTQFEIRAYPAEPAVQVTVFEGVVRLAS
ncbi:MAG TPA: hypothetical protein ENJ82_06315, partial [Bacteroidetes bacterium]|nr:hypothetical protein [Bacteroidota bacterium]